MTKRLLITAALAATLAGPVLANSLVAPGPVPKIARSTLSAVDRKSVV